MRRLLLSLPFVAVVACSCSDSSAPDTSRSPRSWRMGFSVIPPRPDESVALASLDLWTRRADAAIMHIDVLWTALLAGTSAEEAVRLVHLDLANYYRAKGLWLVVTIDVTDGLAREREAKELVAAGRSITEPAVQQAYRAFVRAVVTVLRPDHLGLAAETNLIRLAAPRPVYDAVVRMTNDAAGDVRALASAPPLYVSVQVEVAWGRLQGGTTFVGIDEDLRDFPFIAELGLSSYPYLGGVAEPEEIPPDYYSRLRGARSLPLLVVEGGWPSASLGAFASSPAKQARYLVHQAQLLERASATAAFQLTFTDLDLDAIPQPPGSILPLFATLGLVDTQLRPKASLAVWDSLYAKPLAR